MDTPFNMVDCIEETGKALNVNNHDIVTYLCGIEEERNNLEMIIKKQYEERSQIESEIETLTYKLCLINKSLAMRIKTKNNYDKTIEEIKAHYEQLVDSSNKLRQIVEKTQIDLDSIMNKKVGTTAHKSPSDGPCPCDVPDEPTKEEWSPDAPTKWHSIMKMSQGSKPKTGHSKDGIRIANNGITTNFETKAVEEQIASCDNTNHDKVYDSIEKANGAIHGHDGIRMSNNGTKPFEAVEEHRASRDNTNNDKVQHASVEKASGAIPGPVSREATSLTQEIYFYNGKAVSSDLTPSEEH